MVYCLCFIEETEIPRGGETELRLKLDSSASCPGPFKAENSLHSFIHSCSCSVLSSFPLCVPGSTLGGYSRQMVAGRPAAGREGR